MDVIIQLYICICFVSLFFFSSRRRHTRWPRDWSSDVCSSDLKSLFILNCLRIFAMSFLSNLVPLLSWYSACIFVYTHSITVGYFRNPPSQTHSLVVIIIITNRMVGM